MSALELRGLRIAFDGSTVVDGIDLRVASGECVAIVGESGAGKSLTVRSLLGLLPPGARAETDLFRIGDADASALSEKGWREYRGAKIALVSQDALVSLDPLRRIGAEIAEPLELHRPDLRRAERARRVQQLLTRVWMPRPEQRARQYPHELSGGLRQRALIASALAGDPGILVADEPTTALDATVQARILDLLRDIADAGTAVVFVSHDIAAVRRIADRIIVMRDGRQVEEGAAEQVLTAPQEAYTRELLASAQRPPRAPAPGRGPALRVHEVTKAFGGRAAVASASFSVTAGRTLGIVGESGSGKTTLARMIVGVERPDSGTITGVERVPVQLVHQNPQGAFDPRWTIGRSLAEALEAAGASRAERPQHVAALLSEVDLAPELALRRPTELSGGQRQRAAIARALAAGPRVLVLDEPVSALDPSVRERVLQLLDRLQRQRGLTMLFISHDLDVVSAIADDVIVMQDGHIVEQGIAADVFAAPQHPFTQELLAAATRP